MTKSTIQEMETARAKIDITGAKQEERLGKREDFIVSYSQNFFFFPL